MKYLLCGFLFLMGCGVSNEPRATSYYSYNLKDPAASCETGKKVFLKLEELCTCLQDDNFNNHCAQDKREHEFKIHCKGEFEYREGCI